MLFLYGYIFFCQGRLHRLLCDAIARKPYNQEVVISTHRRLIHSVLHANQYMLLYALNLLSVFSRKSDTNPMTARWAVTTSPVSYGSYLLVDLRLRISS